jgi:predicted DNA-binding transcriptional regulator YafY
MENNDIKRLPRLTAIITQLQTKHIVTATSLAQKFNVSVRTIYRDIRSLEASGIPIVTEEGKGYSLMNGYRIPPIMFTESEANALITVEKLVFKNKDASLIHAYSEAINKIKAVLKLSTKDKANLLSKRILIKPQLQHTSTSNNLTNIQSALTEFKIVQIKYKAESTKDTTTRSIEPFALYHNPDENWNLIAYCRLRNDFRLFRLDRVIEMKVLEKQFKPHKLTLEEYVDIQRKKYYTNP